MLHHRFLGLLTLVWLLSIGDVAGAQAERLVKGQRTIAVRVVEAETEKPLADVEVAFWTSTNWWFAGGGLRHGLELGPGAVVRTDENGFVGVRGAPSKAMILEVRRPLYGGPIEMPEGTADIDLGTIEMAPTGAIRGRLLDPEGNPMSGGSVEIGHSELGEDEPPRRASTRHPPVAVDENGDFVIGGLATGVYRLVGKAEGYSASEDSGDLAVQRGRFTADVALHLRPPGRVVGRVVDAEGAGIAGATVELGRDGLNSLSRIQATVTSGEDGTFEIEAPEGRVPYSVICRAEGLGLLETEVVVRAGKTTELTLEMARGTLVIQRPAEGEDRRIGGWVHLLEGAHSHPGALRNRPEDYGITRQFRPGQDMKLESLEPGLYTVVAFGGKMAFVTDPVEIKANEVTDLLLEEPKRRTLTITVQDAAGGPVPDAQVSLRHLDWGATPTGRADAHGLLTWRGMAPGDYHATVVSDGVTMISNHPVSIGTGGGLQELLLRLPSQTRFLDIRVLSNGASLSNAEVSVQSLVDGARSSGTTDAAGVFRAQGLPPGPALLEATGRARFAVPVETGETLEVVIPSGELAGQIDPSLLEGERHAQVFLSISDRLFEAGTMWQRVQTEADGSFRIHNLPGGPYEVYLISGKRGGQLQISKAASLELREGEIRNLGLLRAGSTPGGMLEYTMRTPEGSDVDFGMAYPLITTQDGMLLPVEIAFFGMHEGRDQPQPLKVGPLPPGAYHLNVISPQYGARRLPFEIVDGETIRKELSLEKGGRVRVTVLDGNGEPQPGVGVMLHTPSGERLPFVGFAMGAGILPITDLQGQVLLNHLPIGSYRLGLTRGDRQALLEEAIEVKTGETSETTIRFE